MKLPTLSVVVPNYNHAHYLPSSLKALLTQSTPALEVIVIDDASTDNSMEVLQGMAREYPTLKVFRNEKNQGVVYNINRGLELSKGDYVSFPAADDEVLPGLFEKSLPLLAAHPQASLSCSVCEWRYVDSGLRFHVSVGMAERPSYLAPEELVRLGKQGRLMISTSSAIFRKDAFCEVGRFIPELRWHADWFACFISGFRYGVCFVPEPLSLVNILQGSYYTAGNKKLEHQQVLLKILELLNSPAFADVRPRVRDSGALSVFAMPMLRILLSRREYRPFLNATFTRRALWRSAELTGKRMLPRGLARAVLKRFYTAPGSGQPQVG